MNNYPEYVEIKGKQYKINTDFRYAIKCQEIAEDESIGDLERALAVIYTLFGKEGINSPDHYESLLKLAQKYLLCGQEMQNKKNEIPDMDFVEDIDLIESSFMSDYHIDLSKENMHWWKFNKLLNGLSNSEMGNCCILNRVRNIRNMDEKAETDNKRRQEIIDAKRLFALKKYSKEQKLTKEQEQSIKELNKILGI